MAIAVRHKTEQFIPTPERAEAAPFTVTIRSLTVRHRATVADAGRLFFASESGEHCPNVGTMMLEAARCGIVGWKNLTDEDGKAIEPVFVNGVLSDESLELCPHVNEIGGQVILISRLTEADAKNSEPSPPSSPAVTANGSVSPANAEAGE